MIRYPLRVAGQMTRVLDSGGAGPLLVLVHGLGSRADRWERNIDRFAAHGYRAVALDLPGHGFASKDPDFDYSIEGYRKFLAAFLDEIGAEKAVLIGASLGGHIAGALAGTYPARVDALIMVGSTGLRPFGPEARAAAPKNLTDMSREAVQARLRRGILDASYITDDLIDEDVQVNNSYGAGDALRQLGRYFAERIDDDIVLESLATLGGQPPILLVWGANDQSIPVAVGEAAHAGLPGSRLVILSDTAHNPYIDKPETFCRVVIDFLGGRLGALVAKDVTYR